MSKILITGGAGYIGSMLCTKLLEEGHIVTVVDLLKYDKGSLNHLYFNKKLTSDSKIEETTENEILKKYDNKFMVIPKNMTKPKSEVAYIDVKIMNPPVPAIPCNIPIKNVCSVSV